LFVRRKLVKMSQSKALSDEEKYQVLNSDDVKKYDRRTFWQVMVTDIQNYVYFFSPLIVIHNLAWMIKPLFTTNPESPWQLVWNAIVNLWGNDPYKLFVFGTVSEIVILNLVVGGLYALLDYFQAPQFLMKYKIQSGKNAPPDTKKLMKVIMVITVNELLGLAILNLEYDWWLAGPGSNMRLVPDVYTAFKHIFVAMICHDFLFYHFHKFLHHRKLYKHIHKIHHEWQAPMAITALYAHPIEHFLTGVISPSMGPLLMGTPLSVLWAWNAWLLVQVMNDHSGYHFPLVFSPEFHDYHHLKFHTSYGWLTFWDWFYGTDIEFMKTDVHKDRHFRIHSSQSAKEIVPDKPKQK